MATKLRGVRADHSECREEFTETPEFPTGTSRQTVTDNCSWEYEPKFPELKKKEKPQGSVTVKRWNSADQSQNTRGHLQPQ